MGHDATCSKRLPAGVLGHTRHIMGHDAICSKRLPAGVLVRTRHIMKHAVTCSKRLPADVLDTPGYIPMSPKRLQADDLSTLASKKIT